MKATMLVRFLQWQAVGHWLPYKLEPLKRSTNPTKPSEIARCAAMIVEAENSAHGKLYQLGRNVIRNVPPKNRPQGRDQKM